MKCHYEVLDVPKDADDADIKSAYRKLALKWHPDKNLDNPELAKEQFQIVQQAYEILSDKQERAWYDKHRDQILKGPNSEVEDKSLDIFQYFTASCYKGFGDDEKGFYSTYNRVFEQLAKEELDYIEDKEEFCEIPSFGTSQSDYEEVVAPFYNYWMGFSTRKSYAWLDPYDIREGRGDRRVLKLIEKENKKVRQKAKKERNDEVRNLVAFVRKRDKRVQANNKAMEAKTLENRKKQQLLSKQKRLERQQQHKTEQQAEWAKFDNFKSELEEIEKNLAAEFGEELSNSEEECPDEDFNNLYCVACNKIFKTPKAFENHESSKKHKENVERLKDEMLEEESYENESHLSDNLEDYADIEHEDEDLEQIIDNEPRSGSESIESKENEEIMQKSKKKMKKQRNIFINHDEDDVIENIVKIDESDDDFDFSSSKKSKKKSRKSNSNKSKATDDMVKKEVAEEGNILSEDKDEILPEETLSKSKKKIKKCKRDTPTATELAEVDTNHCCVTCKANFPSKNKLFDHLKKTNHGIYLPNKTKVKENNRKKKHIQE